MGTGVNCYITKKRMEKACALLNGTALSVKEVAEATGYADALYFERVFRKYAGVPPTEYRRRGENPSVFDAFTRKFYR